MTVRAAINVYEYNRKWNWRCEEAGTEQQTLGSSWWPEIKRAPYTFGDPQAFLGHLHIVY